MPRKHTTIAISRSVKKELDELQHELNLSLKGGGLRIGTKDELLAYMLMCSARHMHQEA